MLEHVKKLIFGKTQAIRCCCFHFGRCGSTLLGNMLDGHPAIDWKSEVFHPFHEKIGAAAVLSEPFELLLNSLASSTKPHYGFETKFQHLDSNGLNLELSDYLSRLQELGFDKFILLVRKNYLRQAISVARGQLTQTWHVASEKEKPEFPKFELDLERVGLGGKNRKIVDCFEFLDQTYEHAIHVFKSMNLDFLHLAYEDDLEQDAQIGYRKTLSFLELPLAQSTASLQKLDGRSLSEMLSNLAELRDYLAKTPYAWMCEDHQDN